MNKKNENISILEDILCNILKALGEEITIKVFCEKTHLPEDIFRSTNGRKKNNNTKIKTLLNSKEF